jgi:hypothetical protein
LTSLTKQRVESLFSMSAAATAPPMPPLPIARSWPWRTAGAPRRCGSRRPAQGEGKGGK